MWSRAKAKENARQTHRNRRELTATAQLAEASKLRRAEERAESGK
jgi:hypothetical protein